ncbi:MAG: hypothetical protein LBI74_06470 [Synergistaceae bacterium]|nr:hypothetical protein [Synergistaceae bacterium]
MEKLKIICDSSVSKPMPKWMSAAAIAVGLALFYSAYSLFAKDGFSANSFYSAGLGAVCVIGAGIRRKLYLSDVGIVRETYCWGRMIRTILSWKDVKHVTLAYKGKNMIAFFEVGFMGWRVPFSRSQDNNVRDVIEEMIPDTEVDTLKNK